MSPFASLAERLGDVTCATLRGVHVTLIRHAQSTNNARWHELAPQDRVPEPGLTDLGFQQGARLAEWARHLDTEARPTHLYCSPMRRAIQTAVPVADALDMPLVVRREICEGGGPYTQDANGVTTPYPGLARAEVTSYSPRLVVGDEIGAEGWWSGPYESNEVVARRADGVLAWLLETHRPGDVVWMVSHGWFIQFLLEAFMALPASPGWFMVHNTGRTDFAIAHDAPTKSECFWVNRLDHLDDVPATV